MKPIVVFYSWQSDRDSDLCRNFIDIALNEAAEQLGRDGVEIKVDADTRNVAGTPPVTDTILEKIRDCDIFVADMTFVASTDKGKQAPNPNVMVEYGYALHALGAKRILLVMNEAFGGPDHLPFDLKHMRRPEQYHMAEGVSDGPRRERRSALAAKLAHHIALVVREVGPASIEARSDRISAAAELAIDRLGALRRGDVPVLVSRPSLTLHLVPLAALTNPLLRPGDVMPVLEQFMPPGHQHSQQSADERMWWTHAPAEPVADRPNREAPWSLLLVRPGLLELTINLSRRIEDDADIVVDGRKLEAWIVRGAEWMIEAAAKLGLAGPAYVAAALEGLDDVHVVAGRLPALRLRRPAIALAGRTFTPGAAPAAEQLRDLLDDLWLAMGRPTGSPSFGGESWDGDREVADFELP